jgi:hypothetical protein
MNFTEQIRCRVCHGWLDVVVDFGEIYPSGFVKNQEGIEKAPLALAQCRSCGLVQLRHTVDLDSMYKQYWYRSGLNKSMLRDLEDVVKCAEKEIKLYSDDITVDIGCNDGSLFNYLTNKKVVTVGFDPALNLSERAEKNCNIFVNDYFSADKYPKNLPKARLITSIAMFYDLPDPNWFIEEVKKILEETGIWIIQFTDLFSMLTLNAFDNVCHEHLEYYSIRNMVDLMHTHGLDIYRADQNAVNGGSLRVYICYNGKRKEDGSVRKYLEKEKEFMASLDNPFKQFGENVHKVREELFTLLESLKKSNMKVFGMGASTKGNTLLQVFGFNKDILPYIAEVNEDKFGLRTIGTDIPIISEEEAFKMEPDAFLLLPWHFLPNIIDKHTWFLNEKNGAFITPLPTPQLYYMKEGKIWTLATRLPES